MTYPLLGDENRAATLAGATIPEIYPWCEAADAVVRARLASSGLSAATLGMIMEHLAAHYYELEGGQVVSSESLGSWSTSFATRDLSDLRSTRNGRIAVELDTSGALAQASKPTPTFAVL
jgi:hypothetical protein